MAARYSGLNVLVRYLERSGQAYRKARMFRLNTGKVAPVLCDHVLV
jgi:hypothetical protein